VYADNAIDLVELLMNERRDVMRVL